LPRTTIRSSFGATRMQQLSHHTLNSALVFWTFITFIVPPGFVWLTRLLLKARDDSACIVCLMSTIFQRAGQHKFSRRQSLAFSCSFAVVEGKQDGHVALLAANTEIPPHVGLGPSRNIQRISLPSERMRRRVISPGQSIRSVVSEIPTRIATLTSCLF